MPVRVMKTANAFNTCMDPEPRQQSEMTSRYDPKIIIHFLGCIFLYAAAPYGILYHSTRSKLVESASDLHNPGNP